MARPRKAIPSIEKNISLPCDLVARVDLELYSDLEEKVPFGAWQQYIVQLIRADLALRDREFQRMEENAGVGHG